MRILSWNCKGLGNSSTVQHGKKIAQHWNPDFLFLLETRLQDGRGTKILSNWGFTGTTEVARIGLSGGLALGWHSEFRVKVCLKNQHFIHIEVVDPVGDIFALTFIYGHPILVHRKKVWDELLGIGTCINHKWICIGDFNQVLSEEDKFTFKPNIIPGNMDLLHTISNLALIPIAAKGLSYTWMNKRKGADFVMEHLDKAFANIEWLDTHLASLVTNLPIIASDHEPIILDTNPRTLFKHRPFRFEWMWNSHPDCPSLVKNAWKDKIPSGSHAFCLTKKLENVRDRFKVWNKQSFRVLDKQILVKKEELRKAQENIHSLQDVLTESKLREQLEDLMDREQIMWA